VPVKTASELTAFSRRILEALGASEAHARRVAEALVASHLVGFDSHGVQILPTYAQNIRAGQIDPRAEPAVLEETASYALVRGNWSFGFVTLAFATRLAVEKAAEQKVAVVGAVEVNHVGRLGEYAEMIASAGQVGILAAGGFGVEAPVAVPYGGRRPILSTNPIAMGFPAEGSPMILDYATTAIAGGKALLARARGEQVPPGCLVDRDGNPTTDPAALLERGGAHVPFGGHKGFALMLAVEFLGRVLTGADRFAAPDRGDPITRHQGVSIIAIDPGAFQPLAEFRASAAAMLEQVRAVPPAPGFERVIAPGDLEAAARRERSAKGIPIPEPTWRALTDLARSVGVEA
jgi:LDH2 family malate/lactate/ureidoglycolate dehydrogenase